MRTFALVVSVRFVMILAGCLEDIGTAYNDFTKDWFIEDTPLAATIAEIDAVRKLRSDSDKYEGLSAIAAREGLHSKAQVHLVKPVFRGLYSESDKQAVLLLLIENPSFSCAAKLEILHYLDKLSSGDNKMNVLRAINKAEPCADDVEIGIES
jgi:hypothetical protein